MPIPESGKSDEQVFEIGQGLAHPRRRVHELAKPLPGDKTSPSIFLARYAELTIDSQREPGPGDNVSAVAAERGRNMSTRLLISLIEDNPAMAKRRDAVMPKPPILELPVPRDLPGELAYMDSPPEWLRGLWEDVKDLFKRNHAQTPEQVEQEISKL